MTLNTTKITGDTIEASEWNESATAANKVTDGTLVATDISDFDTGVSNNTDVVANTAKITNATHTGDVTGDTALTIGVNKVNDTHIDWGTGTNQVSADDIPDGSTNAIITITQETAFTAKMDNLVDDIAPSLGGDLDYNSNGLKLTSQTAGGSNGNAVYLSGSNTWSQADSSVEATCKGQLGIRISATEVLTHGVYTTTGLTVGSVYYVSETAGAITTIAPSTSLSIVRPIGYALSTTELYIDPDKSWVENA